MRFGEILLDLDGVVSDFHTSALRAHRRRDILEYGWPIPGMSLPKALGLNTEDPEWKTKFWKPIVADVDFWADVEPFPWFTELIQMLKQFTGPHGVIICTGPASGTAREKVEKMRWLSKHGINLEVRFEADKYKLAKPNSLLIDDWDKQVNEFRAAGGYGLLFPQPWNDAHTHTENRLQYVLDFLNLPKEKLDALNVQELQPSLPVSGGTDQQ